MTTATSGDPRSSVLVKSGLALADSGDYTCATEYNGIGTLTTAAAKVYVIGMELCSNNNHYFIVILVTVM